MKRITLSFLGAAMLFASCQKNEKVIAGTPEEEVTAEPARKCASQEILEEQLKTDPQRARNLEELEKRTEQFQGRSQSQFRTAGTLYVPVVVNVVLPNADQVTDAQIQTQLDALNADYNKKNAE